MNIKKMFKEIEKISPDKHYDLLISLENFKKNLNEVTIDIQKEFDKKMNDRNFKGVEKLLDLSENCNELREEINKITIEKGNKMIRRKKSKDIENKLNSNDYKENKKNLKQEDENLSYKEEHFPLFLLGREPDELKEEIDSLRFKLDNKYSNKTIPYTIKNDKIIWDTINKLYSKLGYSNWRNFLEAYGYKLLEE